MGGGNVLDDGAGHKIRVGHPRLRADLIVLDPEMTVRHTLTGSGCPPA